MNINRILAQGLLAFVLLSSRLVAQTTQFQTNSLASGWNLIAFQVIPPDANPASVFAPLGANFVAAWTYDNSFHQWTRYARPGTAEATNNTIMAMSDVELGRGYWVYMTAPATWVVSGQTPALTPGVSMTNGWNLVSIPTGRGGLTDSVNMLSLFAVAGLDYDTILKWESGLYRKFTPTDTDVDDFVLFDANKGYWVRVKSPGTFNLQPKLLSSVRADVDVEPQGNYPSFEDLQISPSPTPLNPADQTHLVFLPGEDVQQLALANSGGGILAWDLVWTPQDATNVNWLQLSAASGITTIENDVIQLFLDRTQLPKGTYQGTLLLKTTAGNRSFHVVANVTDVRGEWRGVAKIATVNGKNNEVADIDLHMDFFEDSTTPGLMRGLLDSRNSLLWPVDVPLIGHSGSLSENRFTLGGAFILPPGDLNNPPYATFATGGDPEDVDWNCNGLVDDTNPFPFPIYRSVLLQGGLASASLTEGMVITGDYVETVYGMLRTPIRLEGTFTLRRENPVAFANRRPVTNSESTNGTLPVVLKTFSPGSPLGVPVGKTTNTLNFVTDLVLQQVSVDVDFGDAPASGIKLILQSPGGQQITLHSQANLGTLRGLSFPSLRKPVQSLDALVSTGAATKGNWRLIVENTSGIGGKLYSWSLRLQGQPVFNVTGRIVDPLTGAGVPAQVSLDGLPITAATLANPDGTFSFNRLPGIPVNFTASQPGYQALNPTTPGLAGQFTIPTYGVGCSNATRQAYLGKFRSLPGMPLPSLATDGFGNYGVATNPVVLNLVVQSGYASSLQLLANPSAGFGPLPVQFNATGDTNVIPVASNVVWDFGDGFTTNGINLRSVEHTYAAVSSTGYVATVQVGAVSATNTVLVMPSPGNTLYPENFFQVHFTSGGTIPADLIFSITGTNDTSQPPAFVDLVMVQHADCASFDIDRAPFTTPGNRNFDSDGFTNDMPSLNPADYSNGFKGEDYNYQVTLAQWSSAGDCAYVMDDDIYNPHPKPGFTGDCVLTRYRMVCNIGPQIMPMPDPQLLPGQDGIAKVRDLRLITGPLAADWNK